MESTVAQKLDAIYTLQLIDSRLDAIVKVRGALPEEVQDLEDEIAEVDAFFGKSSKRRHETKSSSTDRKSFVKINLS